MTDETRHELEAIRSELYRLSYRVRALEEQLTRESREPNGGATSHVRPEPETVPVGATPRVRPEPTAETRIRPEPETVPAGANPRVRPYFTPPPPPATPLDGGDAIV